MRSQAGRRGDWRCRCHSSGHWSSLQLPVASSACSSNGQRRTNTYVCDAEDVTQYRCVTVSARVTCYK